KGAGSSPWRCARYARTPPPSQRHSTTSAFFFTALHGGVLALEFLADPRLGLDGPLVERSAAQLTHLLNQQSLHLIGRLQRPLLIARQVEDALHPNHHVGTLTE